MVERSRELEVIDLVREISLRQGTRQRRHLTAEGVPFRGERVDMRVARLPD